MFVVDAVVQFGPVSDVCAIDCRIVVEFPIGDQAVQGRAQIDRGD